MTRNAGVAGLAALTVLIAVGCAGQKNPLLLPNQPPEVELFARADGSAGGTSSYRLQWTGHDPDGVIDHYAYAVGPPSDDPRSLTWTATSERERAIGFPARAPRGARTARASFAAAEPSVFSVIAVDGAGARSAPARVAFLEGELAPRVQVITPPANPLVRYYLPATTCFEWRGTAFDDGGAAARIVEYKYILLSDETAVTIQTARSYPDSVRRYYAPRGWPGWTTLRGNETGIVLRDLPLDEERIFVITCFDEDGDYDPIFSYSSNMIYFRVVNALVALPLITVYNEFFVHQEVQGRYTLFPHVVSLEVPAGQPITFNWYAEPARDSRGNLVAGPIRGYRWALDLADVEDPRQGDPAGHSGHWTPWSLTSTSTTVGPFAGGETHHLYIEANGSVCGQDSSIALLTLKLNTIQPSFEKELLIVDDTRYLLDRINLGTTDCAHPSNRPTGNWPTQAELDTFLYARGGVPWRCYPPGTTSSPGIFNGYSFDTLGTNLRVNDLTVPLATLTRYRNVIWLTDARAALNNRPGSDPGSIDGPQTALRYMNANRQENTLAAYIKQGGRVWLVGGGTATASMINFNRSFNDNTPPIPQTLTFRNADNELIPGRFIYDQAHWRSEFKQFRINNGTIRRYLGRFEGSPGAYAGLPPMIRLKTAATDPFPPNRTGQSPSVFYQTFSDIEFLSGSNEILEDQDPRPPHEDFQPTLDSLFTATAATLRPETEIRSVVMTYYHGADNPPLILTGFNIWNFRRSDCAVLVDFVLQQMWGLTRDVPAPAAVEAGSADAPQPVGRLAKPREGLASSGADRGAGRN
jgi:hypothetical protein